MLNCGEKVCPFWLKKMTQIEHREKYDLKFQGQAAMQLLC